MLNVHDLTLSFSGTDLFSGITFKLNAGDRVGLIGKNGAGKSSLLKLLAGDMPYDKGNIAKEKEVAIGFLRQDIDFTKGRTVLGESYTAFKEIVALEAKMSAINEALAIRTDYESEGYADLLHRLEEVTTRYEVIGGYHYQGETEKILKGLGFKQADFDQPTDTFSGGWRMRIELAKLLLQKNDLLLLDEPTNHLDIESIIWLENFLKNYSGAVVLVSHDKVFLDRVTNRTIEIVRGKIYDYKKPYSEYLMLREELRTQQMQAQKNQERIIKQKERLIEKFRAKASKATMAQSLIKQLDKIERITLDDVDHSTMKLRFPPIQQPGKIVITCEALSKSYEDNKVLHQVDLEVVRGDKIAFVGQNGQGKSTLAKLIVRDTQPTEGVVTLGHNVSIGYFAQNQESYLDGEKTLLETMADAASDANRTKVRDMLGSFLFGGNEVDKKVKVLSGGERNRLAICKMLLEPFNVLVMDEPTNHLDINSKEVLKNALKKYEGTLIVVSHDRDFLAGLTDKTLIFRDQKIKMHLGDVNDFLATYQVENMRILERQNKESKSQATTKQGGKSDWQTEKAIKKVKNKISKTEQRIDEVENKISDLDALFFENAEMASDAEKIAQYQSYKEELSDLMARWEQLEQALEDLK